MKSKFLVKRRYVTLIEMMVVMFLISMIIGVLAYNYQGSLEKGRAFKTEQTKSKIEQILAIQLAEDPQGFDGIEDSWKSYIQQSPLVSDPTKLYTDGWGEEFDVFLETSSDSGEREIRVRSRRYEDYIRQP